MRRPSTPVLLLLLAAGVLVSYSSSLGTATMALALGAPVMLLMIAIVPLAALAAILVASTQLTGGRFPLAGYNLLPEHVVLVAFGCALFVRCSAGLLRRAAVYEVLLLAWIAWNLVVSLLYAPRSGRSLAIVAWMILAWLILWCLRSYFLAEPAGRKRVLDVGAWVAAAVGAVSFALWAVALLGGPDIGVQPEFLTGSLAAKGPTLEANFLGTQELCWLFLGLHGRLLHDERPSPWKVAGVLLGIVASMTRAVWIATLLVLCAAFVAHLRRRPKAAEPAARRGIARPVAVGLLAIVLMVGGPQVEKLTASFDFGSGTAAARLTNWRIAWDDVTGSDAYLTGLGTNSYGQRHLSRTMPGEPDYLGNLPLMVLYDSGLIGVVLFGGAMAALVVRGRSAQDRLLRLVFVLALMIVGAATNPVWLGFVWVTVAVLDTHPEDVTEHLSGVGAAERQAGIGT